MKLLIQNNFSHALDFYQKERPDTVYFSPRYYSHKQKIFFQKRFDELKAFIPQLQWCERLNEELDYAAVLDAQYEVNFLQATNAQNLRQNRLLDHLDFNLKDSFSSFKNKVVLPEFYPNALTPYDSDVIKELHYYFSSDLPLSYFDDRNGLVGRDYSTKFSTFLACGALDVRYLYNRVREYESERGANKSTEWIIFELLWREFFYWHYQKHQRAFFSKNGIKGEFDFTQYRDYSVKEARDLSNLPLWQAMNNELENTGFLSNRARQWYASFWINELELDWRSGASLFEKYLLDYDVYSNWGNWMYLAGVGVDPRGKRKFNLSLQLDRYDPSNVYIKYWLTL